MSKERKVAVITGASQGIGEGLVRGFLDRGYRVVANSRSIKPDASADVLAIAGDISDPAVADRVIGGAVGKFGRVDTLVNNAGMAAAGSLLSSDPDRIDAMIQLNVVAAAHLAVEAARAFVNLHRRPTARGSL